MARVIDEIGNHYGRLIVIKRVKNTNKGNAQWLCKCDCGNESIVIGLNLRNGHSQSCGCLQRNRASEASLVDITGQKYGRLTILSRDGSDKRGASTWICQCKCGNKTVVTGKNLRSGNTKSCGCLHIDKVSLPEGEAAFNAIIARMKCDAKRREIDWQLTKQQVRFLTKQSCHYCGAEPSQIGDAISQSRNGIYPYNGLDRLDNSSGYVPENVVSCCSTCNTAKLDMTVDNFQSWVTKVYEHFCQNSAAVYKLHRSGMES